MNRTPLGRCRVAAGAAAAALVLSLAACSSGTPAAPDAATPAPSVADPAAAQTAEFCSTNVDIETAFNSGPPLEALPPEAVEGALMELMATLDPLLTRAEQTAPEAVSADVATLVQTTRQALSSQDFSAFETPEAATASTNLDNWALAECGYEQVEVTAVNFEYQGLPDTLTAGTKAVTLTNEGDQLHEIAIARINDGVTQSVEELLALPMEEALQNVELKGITFASPGESDTSFLRLDQPGRYFAVCFIPEGTTLDAEGTGPPHFTMGMLGEITVA